MIIDVAKLCCKDCPAFCLKNEQSQNISRWEKLREEAKNSLLKKKVNLYLLCESLPADNFFYDKSSHNELRSCLCKELVGNGSDDDLFQYLSQKGVLLVDCALCPLFRLGNKPKRRYAATLCLQRNTLPYLNLNPSAPIITVFPAHCGFLRRSIGSIRERVTGDFQFSKLCGLKKSINAYI